MISKDLLARVRKIEIRTRRMVDDITAGAYHSVFKGTGIEFDEVREYTSDDDVKDIDWNVTAKMGHPYVKKYVEERELTVMLLVDISASGRFGSGDKTKNEIAAEIASLLAFSAIRNHDKVGLLLFTDRTELYLPPKSGRLHGLRLIRELLVRQPEGRGTNISAALENIVKILHKKAVIFLISDLIDDNSSYKKLLTVANKRHDIIAVRILDPKELELPQIPGLSIFDSENDTLGYFSGGKKAAAIYSERVKKLHHENKDICRKAKVDLIDIRSDQDLVKPLMTFFRQREKLVHRV
jgi:uncharacterized protein (DUF58 family)